MAHECPDCGQVCYCGGDLDDCELNLWADQMRCTHYEQCGRDEDDWPDDDGEEYAAPWQNRAAARSAGPDTPTEEE
jgi:hypothetical protein